MRARDCVFRIGGDEFLILPPEANRQEAREATGRISAIRFAHPDLDEPVTLTIGLAAYPEDGSAHDALFRAADRRLYEGKSDGRNRIITAQ